MAEGARLESVFRLTPNEGSNPSLSVLFKVSFDDGQSTNEATDIDTP